MTTQKTLKKRIRARMQQTGERYTQARDALLAGDVDDSPAAVDVRGIVRKINQRSARVRILGVRVLPVQQRGRRGPNSRDRKSKESWGLPSRHPATDRIPNSP